GPAGDTQTAQTAEQFSATKRMKPDACIHCHQIYNFRREDLKAAGKWTREKAWVYPLPDNLGVKVEPDQGNKVRSVASDSPAARMGLRAGDTLRQVDHQPVASFADVQYALHLAPAKGQITITWQRGERTTAGEVELPEGWRKTDISWRESMWGLEPA